MLVLVSGKSGSGKSVVAKYLADKLAYYYVDLDDVSRNIRDDKKEKIARIVNEDIIVNDAIDSKKLGAILFSNKELMTKYNLFIYEEQKKVLDRLIKENENLVIDSMFLPIMDIFEKGDYKILVTCDDSVRYKRIMERDNIELEYLKKRDTFSLDYDISKFDVVIDNSVNCLNEVDKIIKIIKGE